MTTSQCAIKRLFDITASIGGLLAVSPVLVAAFCIATISTRTYGLYSQLRIGKDGKPFRILKIRSMRSDEEVRTNVTVVDDPRITRCGRFLRKWKIDELPQLINVLRGDMSFVGPRPDVPGYADCLTGDDRIILSVRPGITGPAELEYRDEETLLARQADPEKFNRDVIWPDKVRLNKKYIVEYSFGKDVQYLWETVFIRRRAHEYRYSHDIA